MLGVRLGLAHGIAACAVEVIMPRQPPVGTLREQEDDLVVQRDGEIAFRVHLAAHRLGLDPTVMILRALDEDFHRGRELDDVLCLLLLGGVEETLQSLIRRGKTHARLRQRGFAEIFVEFHMRAIGSAPNLAKAIYLAVVLAVK